MTVFVASRSNVVFDPPSQLSTAGTEKVRVVHETAVRAVAPASHSID